MASHTPTIDGPVKTNGQGSGQDSAASMEGKKMNEFCEKMMEMDAPGKTGPLGAKIPNNYFLLEGCICNNSEGYRETFCNNSPNLGNIMSTGLMAAQKYDDIRLPVQEEVSSRRTHCQQFTGCATKSHQEIPSQKVPCTTIHQIGANSRGTSTIPTDQCPELFFTTHELTIIYINPELVPSLYSDIRRLEQEVPSPRFYAQQFTKLGPTHESKKFLPEGCMHNNSPNWGQLTRAHTILVLCDSTFRARSSFPKDPFTTTIHQIGANSRESEQEVPSPRIHSRQFTKLGPTHEGVVGQLSSWLWQQSCGPIVSMLFVGLRVGPAVVPGKCYQTLSPVRRGGSSPSFRRVHGLGGGAMCV
eukprot:scaffold4498_cov117-Cylindrotheca_fusiformis.AAC.1